MLEPFIICVDWLKARFLEGKLASGKNKFSSRIWSGGEWDLHEGRMEQDHFYCIARDIKLKTARLPGRFRKRWGTAGCPLRVENST